MKKIFRFALAAAVMLSLGISCGKDGGKEKEEQKEEGTEQTDEGNKEEGKTDEGTTEEPAWPKYILTMDGDDSDWAKLDQTYVVSLTAPEGRTAGHDLLKSAKIYVDPDFINIYFTFQDTIKQAVNHNLYVDFDNSDETGGYDNQFTDPNSEISFQTQIRKAGETEFISLTGTLYEWSGEVGGKYNDPNTGDLKNNWEWTSIMSISDIALGAGKSLGGGISAYEYQIRLTDDDVTTMDVTERYDMNATQIGIGVDILAGWTDVGCLPIGVDALAPKAKVKIAPAYVAE